MTGRPVFARATLSDTLAAVVHVEPDWRALPHNVPASFVRLLKRCLQKDPAKRLRDIGDARLELEDVDVPVGPSDRRTSVGGVAVAVSITAAVIATSVALWLVVREPLPDAQRAVRFAVTLQPDEQVQYEAGVPRPFAISSAAARSRM